MKKHKHFLMGAIAMLFVISVFWAGNALAATCFTDISSLPTVFQDAICWMKDNGVTSGYADGTYKPSGYVTRAQMALFMKNQAQVPPETGQIIINAGPDKWQVGYGADAAISRYNYDTYTSFTRSSIGGKDIILVPEIPAVLYGRQLSAVGLEYCYTASANARVSGINGWLNTQTAGTGAPFVNLFTDNTERTDAACRYYAFSTPRSLDDNHILSVFVTVYWASAPAEVRLGRVTLFLVPTTTALTGPTGAEITGQSEEPVTKPGNP